MKRTVLIAAIGVATLLAGCTERYVVSAGEQMLVVAEDVTSHGGLQSATIHYILPQPRAVDSDAVTEMVSKASVKCQAGQVALHDERLLLASGGESVKPAHEAEFETPKPGSVTASVVRVLCDPKAMEKTSSYRPLKAMRRHYLKLTATTK